MNPEETTPQGDARFQPDAQEPAQQSASQSGSVSAPMRSETMPLPAVTPTTSESEVAYASAPAQSSAPEASAEGETLAGVPAGPAPTLLETHSPRRGPGWGALVLAMACTAGLAIGGTLVIGQNLHSSVTTPLVSQTSAPAQSNSAGSAVDWENVAQTVSPAVVTISVSAQNSSGLGSGAIVDSAGNIVTNYHVISSVVDGSGRIQVTLTDGRIYEAKIVGTDKSTDLAVIRLVNPPSDLVAAQFGQSSDLKVGQPVMAIGSPLGLSNTVTTGIVSALNRPVQVQASESQNQDNSKDPFGQLQQQGNQSQSITTNAIQVDASINPGNSGGPLFNEHGQVIGINSSIASLSSSSNSEAGSIGLGFAIPSDLVVSVINQLIQNGTVDHARLGVTVSTGAARVGNDTRAGAQISGVSQGSGAEAAGLKAGDVITKIDGNTVTSAQSLVGYVRRYTGGQEVSVTYVRDGVENTAKVTLQSEH